MSATATVNGSVLSVGISEVKAVRAPERLRTVLGSCVGIAIFDSQSGVGGLAHVMLPESNASTDTPGKFADTGTDLLVQQVLAAGAVRNRLRAKIAGGATMFGPESNTGIGRKNAEAVINRLAHHNIGLLATDLGGSKGRRMSLDPSTGDVEVQFIGQEPRVL